MSDIVALERALAGHAGNYSAYRRHHEQQAASADAALATPAQNAMPACASATTPSSDAARAMRGRRATPIRRPSCWA